MIGLINKLNKVIWEVSYKEIDNFEYQEWFTDRFMKNQINTKLKWLDSYKSPEN